jgi:hypothetical protein
MVSDLIEMINQIKNFAVNHLSAEKRDAFTKDLQVFLEKRVAQSKGRDGRRRTFASLLNGRVKLQGQVVRIELRDDLDRISNKVFDLSTKSVGNLITVEERDAIDILQKIKQEK